MPDRKWRFSWKKGDIKIIKQPNRVRAQQAREESQKAELLKWRDKTRKRGRPTDWNPEHISTDMVKAINVAQEHSARPEDAFRFLKAVEEIRSDAEDDLRTVLEQLFKDWLKQFSKEVTAGNEPPWKDFIDSLTQSIRPEISSTMTEAVLRESLAVGIGFDPAAVNAAALDWARTYTYDLVTGLTETTRKTVSQAVAQFLETPGMTRGELEALLEPAFGPQRAEMIAITEVTRASSEATKQYQQYIAEAGLQMVRIWNTANDELVCPICGPLNGKPETEWIEEHPSGPPAHVRCRCWTTLRVAE